MAKYNWQDVVVLIIIAFIGLLTAYVTFGILDSQAESTIKGYSVSGAIAGALLSWSLLASVYKQFRRSSGELQDLRKRNDELQQKLLRGTPRPENFDTVIDERQSIVLAVPEEWEPRGGTIFEFEQSMKKMSKSDIFPAFFKSFFFPITADTNSSDEYYERYQKATAATPEVGSYVSEFIYIGGHPNPIKSLKIIAKQYIRINEETDILTGKVSRIWWVISPSFFNELYEIHGKQEHNKSSGKNNDEHQKKNLKLKKMKEKIKEKSEDGVKSLKDSEIKKNVIWIGDEDSESKKIRKLVGVAYRLRVLCFHSALRKIFYFDFVDYVDEFPKSSAAFNKVLDSVRFLI